MFVGWIRKDSLESDLNEFEKSAICDKNLILNTAFYNQRLCFGVYDGKKLQALISAYSFANSIYINNFYYTKQVGFEIQKRLLKLLLQNIDEKKVSMC